VQSAQADLWSEVRNLRQETAKLQGRLQTQIRRAEKQTNGTERMDKLETRLKELEDRLETMVSRLGLDSLEGSEDAATRSKKKRVEPEEIPAEKLYEKALSSFKDRKYKRAINLWALFIKKRPDSDLVPNAYFWQGECYYQLQDYSQAALKYQKVVENYPDSGKHPAALLKQGLSFYRLDKAKPGRILLQRLVDNYPDTSEAKRARKHMERQ
jgi:tol-pal system protein YbgF